MFQLKKNIFSLFSKIKNIAVKNKIAIIAAAALFFAFNLVHFAALSAGKMRCAMYFSQVGSDRTKKEIRYIPKNKSQTALENYISELLLGPQIQRARPLFSLGTSLDFCILNDGILYVGLSSDAVFQDNEACDFYEGSELLKKNIRKNFSKVRSIEIFAGDVCVEPAT